MVQMKIAKLEFFPIRIAYTHREVSSQVNRDGVSDVIVKATTDDGLVGWGESCSGANLASGEETLRAMEPFVLGRSPWSSEAIRMDLWHKGVWLALWDICGKLCNQPLYNLQAHSWSIRYCCCRRASHPVDHFPTSLKEINRPPKLCVTTF